MAQYSGRRRVKHRHVNEKAIHSVGFAIFGQCLQNSAPDAKNAFTEIVTKTKTMLRQTVCEERGRDHLPHETETVIEENVEMGEEEILRHDYDLERV